MNDDFADWMTRALSEVCFGAAEDFPLAETVDRYFSADFVEIVDGARMDREQFLGHLQGLRTMAVDGRIEVFDALLDGMSFAQHHLMEMVAADGTTVAREVFMFGELTADGRIGRISEVSRDPSAAT